MDPNSQYTPYVSTPTEGYNDSYSKKKRWPWVALAVVVIAVAVGFGGMKFWSGDDAAADQPMAEVQISADGFRPITINAKVGDDVMWVNKDGQPHQVYAEQSLAPGLDSQEPLAEGDAYIYTFDKPGTYNYYDPLNPTAYKGTVVVE